MRKGPVEVRVRGCGGEMSRNAKIRASTLKACGSEMHVVAEEEEEEEKGTGSTSRPKVIAFAFAIRKSSVMGDGNKRLSAAGVEKCGYQLQMY